MVFIVGVDVLMVIHVIIACGSIVGVVLLILVLIVVAFLFAIHVSHK